MDCTQTRGLLHGYVDKELDLASVIAVDQHLQSCIACKKTCAQYSALRSAVRQHASYYTAPAVLGDRIRAKIGGLAAHAPAKTDKHRPQWFQLGQWLQLGTSIAATAVKNRSQWLQLGTAVAATAAVTWMAALQLNNPLQDEAISEQVIAGYARSVLTSHITDVATSDQHTVKPWLSGKLDFSPPVTDLMAAGFPLVGGRLDYLDKRPVAALVYSRRQHMITLFVWPDSKSDKPAAMQTLSKHGYNLLHWADAGMTYWAISDVDPADLKTFAETYASAK
jgi:anti-sigma factor RsiW